MGEWGAVCHLLDSDGYEHIFVQDDLVLITEQEQSSTDPDGSHQEAQ
jgi:hypothetical protein